MRIFLATNTPITLWGPVGARKTRTIESLAFEKDENGVPYNVITMQPSTQDPTIIHGMMYTAKEDNKTVMKRSIPDVAKQVVQYHEEKKGYTIIFADEMTTCMVSQQNAMLGILTHGKYESTDISHLITIVMAANPENTVSTVNPLGEAVINRGGHIPWYGDVDLFLSDWSSGFNGATERPKPQTEWLIRELLRKAPTEAFRNTENWSTDNLVPYDLIEHTERTTTELAKIVTFVNELFEGAKKEVRHFYIVEITRALQGHDWAKRMETVLQKEPDALHYSLIVEKVQENSIDFSTTLEEYIELTNKNKFLEHNERIISEPLFEQIIDELYERIEKTNSTDKSFFLTAWILCINGFDFYEETTVLTKIVELTKIISKTSEKNNDFEKKEYIPKFLSKELTYKIKKFASS